MSDNHTTVRSGKLAALLALVAGSLTSVSLAQGPGGGVAIAKASTDKGFVQGGTVLGTNTGAAKPGEKPADKAKVRVSDQNLVDLHVKDEDLNNVLEMLSIQGQKNIIVSKNVSGKVTMNLWNVTFYEALSALLHSNGFAYVEKGDFVYVYTVDELEKLEKTFKQRKALTVRLNYLNAPDAAAFVKGMLSKEGEITTTPKVTDFKIGSTGPTGADDYSLGAMLVISDYEENIKAITALLAEMDTKPAQVLIESTVLQTKLTEENAFGVDFALIKDINFSDFSTIATGPRGVVDALIGGAGASPAGVTPADNQAIAGVSTVGGTSGKGGLKLGLISGNVSAFVRLLDEVSDTTVLANPKLLTLNRQPSRVLVGRRVAYLSTTATETSATQSVQYLDTGVQLYVRPFVSSSGDIRMEIKPQVSTADIKEIKGPTGNIVTVPDEVTQEVVTNIIVPDGMTVVLGGLFTETTVAGRSQIPGLGELPIIGAAFRGQSDRTTRDEIIFLVTPTIVNDKTLIAQGVQAKGVEDRMRTGMRTQLLPWSRERMAAERTMKAEEAARKGDYQVAMNYISSAISIYPQYEDALRLRERITGERETWPTGSRLQGVVGTEVHDRMMEVQPAPAGQKPVYHIPFGHPSVPSHSLKNPDQQANTAPAAPSGLENLPSLDKVVPVFTPEALAVKAPVVPETPVVSPTPVEHIEAPQVIVTAPEAPVQPAQPVEPAPSPFKDLIPSIASSLPGFNTAALPATTPVPAEQPAVAATESQAQPVIPVAPTTPATEPATATAPAMPATAPVAPAAPGTEQPKVAEAPKPATPATTDTSPAKNLPATTVAGVPAKPKPVDPKAPVVPPATEPQQATVPTEPKPEQKP